MRPTVYFDRDLLGVRECCSLVPQQIGVLCMRKQQVQPESSIVEMQSQQA